jgi:protein involved in polysaccharide export with SLBB domain
MRFGSGRLYPGFFCLCVLTLGCNKPAATPATTLPASRPARVGRPGDQLVVEITDLSPGETNRISVRVSDKGEIRLPLVGDVKAVGLSAGDLEKAIKKVYADRGLVRDCHPSVKFDP